MSKKKEEVPLPEMGSVEDISIMDPQIITEGYNEAKALKRSIKEAAEILDDKAMKFIGFLVTVIIALIAAFWVLQDAHANNIYIYLVTVEIAACIISMLWLVFGVISGNSFYMPGRRPEYFFYDKDVEWYNNMDESINASERNKLFLALQIQALSSEINHNEKALQRIVRNYRRSIWLLGSLTAVLGFLFLVCRLSQ